jgi:hypothetical protein
MSPTLVNITVTCDGYRRRNPAPIYKWATTHYHW